VTLDAHVTIRLGALDLDVELAAGAGPVVAVLGPNGAGKTTLLRALAGLVPLDGGHVRLDGETLDDATTGAHVPTHRRPVGMVFQDYLLFAHLSALDNVAFGLVVRGVPRPEARRRAAAWLDRMGLAGSGAARPAQLSGGQGQRVALARALATEPRLLLLDEPLAAVDASAKAELRAELRHHLAEVPGVRVLVTHDPLEAMLLADEIVIVEAGRVTQRGTPSEVSARPRSAYVADLVGVNLFRGIALDDHVRLHGGGEMLVTGAPDGPVLLALRPQAVALHTRHPEGTPRNVWPGRVAGIEGVVGHGDRVRVRVLGRFAADGATSAGTGGAWAPGRAGRPRGAGEPEPTDGGEERRRAPPGPDIVAEVTPAAVSELGLHPGAEVWVSVKATEVSAYPA
jgi:molybdate transport system ATP-binding protein